MSTPRRTNVGLTASVAAPPDDRRPWLLGLALCAALALLAPPARGAPAAGPDTPVTVEAAADGGVSRVRLSAQAARRIGLQTTPVRLSEVVRTRRVGGEVVAARGAPAGNAARLARAAAPATPGPLWVRVSLSEGDAARLNREGPVRVLPLSGRGPALVARWVRAPGPADEEGDAEDTDATTLYYAPSGPDARLSPGQRVFVELTFGQGARRTLVPYSAVVYDLNGETWVYTAVAPLTYQRQEVSVDYIEGDQVVLSEGPAAGTPVVSVGAAELYGAESGVGGK